MAVEPAQETRGWWDDGSALAAGGLTSGVPLNEPQVFSYKKPDRDDADKFSVWLAKSDIVVGTVQVIREGGEHRLHSHTDIDSFWFVLSGRVEFYGAGDVLTTSIGPQEGLVTPRGWRYWFKATEPTELLHVTGVDQRVVQARKGGSSGVLNGSSAS